MLRHALPVVCIAIFAVFLWTCGPAPDKHDRFLVVCHADPVCPSEFPIDYYVCTGKYQTAESVATAACEDDLATLQSGGACTTSMSCECLSATVTDDCETDDLRP